MPTSRILAAIALPRSSSVSTASSPAGAGRRGGGGDVQRVAGDAQLRRHAVAERHVGGDLNEDLPHRDYIEGPAAGFWRLCVDSPVVHRSVEPAVDGQVLRVEREGGSRLLVELDADAGGVAGCM